ncbi:MAG: hypothetical protein U1E27_08360 [Kiritimatiellia bacterium]|nr:hypothetical protein [Kiritimatiellia bacterium]
MKHGLWLLTLVLGIPRGFAADPADAPPAGPREFVEAQQRLYEQLLPRPEAERKVTLR